MDNQKLLKYSLKGTGLFFLLFILGIFFGLLGLPLLSEICFRLLPFMLIPSFLFGIPYIIRGNIQSFKRIKRGESIFAFTLDDDESTTKKHNENNTSKEP